MQHNSLKRWTPAGAMDLTKSFNLVEWFEIFTVIHECKISAILNSFPLYL